MRPFVLLLPLLFLAASAAGCGSKIPADSVPPPGVIENPVRPTPEAMQRRKQLLIDPRRRSTPVRFDGKR